MKYSELVVATTVMLTAGVCAQTSENTRSSDSLPKAVGLGTQAGSSALSDYLSQFGTARVSLNMDNEGHWDDSSADFLGVLYEKPEYTIFTQLGARAPDDRWTGNFGLGARTYYVPNWLFGANIFLDDDFTGSNRRVGIGGEAWTDYLKLSANGYIHASQYHQSRDFDDYDERPADGWDVRVEGFLPQYPQLGAKLVYEQYYGDNVALFDKDTLEKDPSAYTMGLSYTPVPLVQLATNYRHGDGGDDDAQFQVNFRYAIGTPFRDQLDGSQVAAMRRLDGSRHDLVERNNEIVLDYRKHDDQKPTVTVNGLTVAVIRNSVEADGVTKDVAAARVTNSDGTAASNVSVKWQVSGSAKLAHDTTVTDNNGYTAVGLSDAAAETVLVQANVESLTQTSQATFKTSGGADTAANVAVSTVKATALADGMGQVGLKARVTDTQGTPIANKTVEWSLSSGTAAISRQKASTNSDGIAAITVTDTVGEQVTATAKADNASGSGTVKFVATQPIIAGFTLTHVKDGASADGVQSDIVQLEATDANRTPASNVDVTWSVDGSSTAVTKRASARTDANGRAYIVVTDTKDETITVSAKIGHWKPMSMPISFVTSQGPYASNVIITYLKNNAVADGKHQNVLRVHAQDSSGQPMNGATITWSTNSTTVVKERETTSTNDKGDALFALADTVAETVKVTAASGEATDTDSVVFTDAGETSLVR